MTRETYKSWTEMRQRVLNPRNCRYKDYGGRGISIDPRWDSYKNFLQDMGKKPVGLSLDRVDNNGDYSKENCRWATPKEQNNNRRDRRLTSRSMSGILNVHKDRALWIAKYRLKGRWEYLYKGTNFFEACCARKSWEARNSI